MSHKWLHNLEMKANNQYSLVFNQRMCINNGALRLRLLYGVIFLKTLFAGDSDVVTNIQLCII